MKRHVRRLVVSYSIRNRERKAAAITAFMQRQNLSTAVLVGVGGGDDPNGAIVERAVAAQGKIVAACDMLLDVQGGLPYVRGDGRALPFRAGAVDIVVSNAVVEHVGQEADQRMFVAEHCRVGRAWVMTTPNKWFPVESHTSTLFRHWSPAWRRKHVYDFTRLLSRREFRSILPSGTEVVGRWWAPTFMAFAESRPGRGGTVVSP